ncbi:fungal-specific transcription factor domain-containing protein [Melanogaster broomeanus]|nr:fungal-specific transcription factor domain-containing protein [Melanogaster broomeanus]
MAHSHSSRATEAWNFKRPQADATHGTGIAIDLEGLSFPDDYDDADELGELPGPPPSSSQLGQTERLIRRRSSKGRLQHSPGPLSTACDQCRKSKCKCERPIDGDACKSCTMLGTACTFLGPSRKRGPPKGYIDAIEARLHQTEALLGVLLSVEAERTEGPEHEDGPGKCGRDMEDTLAREILNRVDSSPYGVKGRQGGSIKVRPHAHAQEGSSGSGVDLHSTHPSNEWQDRVTSLVSTSLRSPSRARPFRSPAALAASTSNVISLNDPHPARYSQSHHGSIHLSHLPEGPQVRRQRRRVEGHDEGGGRDTSPPNVTSTITARNGSASPGISPAGPSIGDYSNIAGSTDSDSEDDIVEAVGQLSLNEDHQVRYHGKASGLYLLGINAKEEARNKGGIWYFPKARVWPLAANESTSVINPLTASAASSKTAANASTGHLPLTSAALHDDVASMLPKPAVQEHLLELYFTYVHTAFPIVHKDAFWEGYRNMQHPTTDTPSPASDQAKNEAHTSPTPSLGRRPDVSPLLLLSMFGIAARYSSSSSPPPSPCNSSPISPHPPGPAPMWTAGDNYLMLAKSLLDNKYASSHPSTVLSLLLLGYREIGIGAMAQAWAYTGMAVRMAQDLGMHRAADGWARVDLGRLFSARELQERRKIWWGCVILDGYVSTYIGRPLAIFESDYDTQFPSTDEPEEKEMWAPHPSLPPDTRGHGYHPGVGATPPVSGRILSCFTASATLSTILSKIVQSIYAIRFVSSRHAESIRIEGLLDKWYLDLPEHLRFELRYDSSGSLSSTGGMIPPHILTLHMQYWCTTLLLHRPFKSENTDDVDVRAASKKSYELCVGAANHIASIVTFYREKYSLQRAPVFLCFYVFTAAIMHVTNLATYPNDPQARMGLTKCMNALQDMEVVWPSAARAHELLRGSNPLNSSATNHDRFQQYITHGPGQERVKRAAEHAADSEDPYERSQMHAPPLNASPVAPTQPYAQTWRSTQYDAMSQDGAQGPQQGELSPSARTSASHSSSYYPWPSDGGSYMSFPGTLSTSVLPQMYSTGLIDERRLPHSLSSSHNGQQRTGGRYPQFWNDCTSFPQMGMAYQPPPHHQLSSHPHQDELYLNGQYGNI